MIKTTTNLQEATVVTHGGVFHADEVMATVILHKLFGDITVARVFSVPHDISEDVIVYDIGGGKYDHHHKDKKIRKDGVPYAAVGLLWREFGRKICLGTPDPEFVWKEIDDMIIKGIDAIDNLAIPKTDYPAQAMSFSEIICLFNPDWYDEKNFDEAFIEAVSFAEVVFDKLFERIVDIAKVQKTVEEAIEKSEGHIMILDKFLPWEDVIFSSKNSKAAEIQYVIFPSNRVGYNWYCVPKSQGSFEQRKPVPENWKGLRNEALQEATGVKTAIFCHPAGFIGAAETLDDAIKIAQIAVNS